METIINVSFTWLTIIMILLIASSVKFDMALIKYLVNVHAASIYLKSLQPTRGIEPGCYRYLVHHFTH